MSSLEFDGAFFQHYKTHHRKLRLVFSCNYVESWDNTRINLKWRSKRSTLRGRFGIMVCDNWDNVYVFRWYRFCEHRNILQYRLQSCLDGKGKRDVLTTHHYHCCYTIFNFQGTCLSRSEIIKRFGAGVGSFIDFCLHSSHEVAIGLSRP